MIKKDRNGLWKIKNYCELGILLVVIGIGIRIFMLIYYYITHLDPGLSWGDVMINYHTTDSMFTGDWIWDVTQLEYPPLTLYFLIFFKVISFGVFEVFVFYAFILELLISLSFYFILKKFDIKNRLFVLGTFLVNPFLFLNNIFSPINCGYHITDSFFYIFLLISLYYYPKEDKTLFYLFSGLTMSVKWFTLPAAAYFFFKFLFSKNWREVKKIFIYIGIPIIIFLITPIFYLPNYLDLYIGWLSSAEEAALFNPPLIFKLLLFGAVFVSYMIFRIKKADLLEITFFSIIVMFSVLFWRRTYVRYLTPLILYGHLTAKESIFTINIDFKIARVHFQTGNHLLTYFLSILGCLASIAIILFLWI